MLKNRTLLGILLCGALVATTTVCTGCTSSTDSAKAGKVEVELVQYKPEAVDAFEEMAERFNATHDDVYLTVSSPNEATTVLKTRFVREDYPDIIGIGGDMNYSNFLDADLFMDISDWEGLSTVKSAYLEMDEQLELIPKDGTYAVPYVANCAGILYNKEMFEEHGWEIPTTWDEFTELCETIQGEGITPLYFGFKDTWTCMAPWNALAVSLTSSDTCNLVNLGETTFSEAYVETSEKIKALLAYAEPNPYAYSYNDACTAFARGESAMYPIGSYAVPQIQSVNPDIQIDSFVFPASNDADQNVLNSGIDLQFCVMKENEDKKEAIYEVLSFLYEDETIQIYLDDQNAIPCKDGDFELPSMLDGMAEYIQEGKMVDFQDHHYPSEMSVDAMVQTYLMDDSDDALTTFLTKFDTDWERYNRDLIAKVLKYNEGA